MAAGDVNVNALTPITSEPTTTDSLVAVNRNTNEGQIIDYNLLADKILAKLTSKTYSGLSTTSKILIGAINELDSDVASLNSSVGSVVLPKTGDVISIRFDTVILAVSDSRCYGVCYFPFMLSNTNYSVNISYAGSIVNIGTPTVTVNEKRQTGIMFFLDAPTGKTFARGNAYYWNGEIIEITIA